MIDPRENDIPLEEIATIYFGHQPKTMHNWIAQKKYPFPIYQLGERKSPWFVSRKSFAEYQRQKMKESETLHSMKKENV
jgi:hypothetical protein